MTSPFDAPDNCANCRGPRLCSYHEGWMDALDAAKVRELRDVVDAVPSSAALVNAGGVMIGDGAPVVGQMLHELAHRLDRLFGSDL